MKSRIYTLATVAALALTALAAPLSAQTLGQRVDSGRMSVNALEQLIAATGLTVDEARQATLDDVVRIRWQDD